MHSWYNIFNFDFEFLNENRKRINFGTEQEPDSIISLPLVILYYNKLIKIEYLQNFTQNLELVTIINKPLTFYLYDVIQY